jgi:hypothetical protein
MQATIAVHVKYDTYTFAEWNIPLLVCVFILVNLRQMLLQLFLLFVLEITVQAPETPNEFSHWSEKRGAGTSITRL